ncbi:hypothetical protein STEG23_003722 [Scotinomys teguina]
MEERILSFISCSKWHCCNPPLVKTVEQSWPWCCECQRARSVGPRAELPLLLVDCCVGWAQNQGHELAHPNIHPMYQLLEHVKGPDLQIESFRISTTQNNNRIAKRIPVRAQYDSIAEARGFETNNPLQRTLTSKDVWTKGYTVRMTGPH